MIMNPSIFSLRDQLPPIIFNSGYHLRRDLFFRHIVPIFLFACIGTALASGIFATFLYLVRNMYPGFEPSFLELMTFGALISATDPVSTLAVFQAKQVDPHLFYLVFGESVINDAVGLVLFEALAHLVEKYSEEPDLGSEFSQFLFDFAMGFVGSTILGILCGMGCGWFFKVMDFRHTPFVRGIGTCMFRDVFVRNFPHIFICSTTAAVGTVPICTNHVHSLSSGRDCTTFGNCDSLVRWNHRQTLHRAQLVTVYSRTGSNYLQIDSSPDGNYHFPRVGVECFWSPWRELSLGFHFHVVGGLFD